MLKQEFRERVVWQVARLMHRLEIEAVEMAVKYKGNEFFEFPVVIDPAVCFVRYDVSEKRFDQIKVQVVDSSGIVRMDEERILIPPY
jgi:hypothetical protein